MGSRGYRVGLLSRDQQQLHSVDEEVRRRGGEGLVLVADVADRGQVERAVQGLWSRWGRIDVLVNNAGYLVYGSVEDCRTEDFERQIAVNYLGAVYCTKAVLPHMRRQDVGAIVIVSSISGRIYLPFNGAYQASKAALRAFALTLRSELRGSNISVSLISPGRTRTAIAMQAIRRTEPRGRPLLREMPVERISRIVVDCADRPRREVVVPLTLRALLFMYSIAPELIEAWLPRLQAVYARLAH